MRCDVAVIGLTGPMGAGKSQVAAMLARLSGYERVVLSAYVREEAERSGREVTRELLQEIGSELRRRDGSGAVAALALRDVRERGLSGVVIDGIRSTGEIDVLRAGSDRFRLIAVDAPEELRYQRHLSRGYLVAPTRERFLAEDRRERGEAGSPFEIDACMELAKVHPWGIYISNDGSFRELEATIQELWPTIR